MELARRDPLATRSEPASLALPRPLEAVRRGLRIAPVGEAHPGGLFRSTGDGHDVVRVPA